MEHHFIEWFGYSASFVVLLSLMMSSLLPLRILNSIGAVMFMLYGVFIGALPVFVLNAGIVGVNIFYIYKYLTCKQKFTLLKTSISNPFVKYFLEKNQIKLPEKKEIVCIMLENEIVGILQENQQPFFVEKYKQCRKNFTL